MAVKLPLRGVRVQLAASIPDDATELQSSGIRAFVEALALALFREGGSLLFGSHPTLLSPLVAAAESFVRSGGAPDALTLVRSHLHATSAEELLDIETQRKYAAVHIIPPSPTDKAHGLLTLREWMSERSDVIVAVGGRWFDTNKRRAGVPVELEEALARGKAAFVMAGFGGAAAGYVAEDTSILARCRNGLSDEDNRTLTATTDVAHAVGQIIGQLKRLPLCRESVPSSRLFRILALDGGGLRGAFTAAVLAKWDEMLGAGGGNGLVSNFDLVAGTSTGAILAIGLGLGLTPKEILEFYRTKGDKIFPKDRKLRHWVKSKHDSETLRALLESVFGQSKLSEHSCCRLVIPTVRATHGEADLIVTAHHPDRTGYRDIMAVDAALASSAAPTYFDEAYVDDGLAAQPYLDGGIWANNPVLPAIAEAVRHLGIPIDRIDVLSVGTMGNELDFTESLGKGKAGWATSSIDLFFAAQEHAAVEVANSLLTPARHLRVNQQTPTPILLDDAGAIGDMMKRGGNVGIDSFPSVRSRFLDGFHAPDWRDSK